MIRQGWLWLPLLAVQAQSATAFFAEATSTESYGSAATNLFGRADTCPSNTFQCSEELGEQFADVCCQDGQTCALDANNNAACCPSGAVCTGTAPASATGEATAVASYVSNAYFSFPYAPTSYDDSAECKSAVTDCSENYDACVTYLESGSQYAVTIAVPGGGGTTVAAAGGSITGSSATAICSSLSSQACSNLEATACSVYGSTAPSTCRADFLIAGFGIAVALYNVIA